MHKCSTCRKTLPPVEFHADRTKASGLASRCKPCVKAYRADYYAANAEKAKADALRYAKENAARHKAATQHWRVENRERWLENRKTAHRRNYANPVYALGVKVRAMIQRTLKATGKPKDFVTFQKIGFTTEQLKARLEMNFQPGMTWTNFGQWEIDHRVPLSRMLARGETRPERLNCLANLKPLWREQNRSKGARYAS